MFPDMWGKMGCRENVAYMNIKDFQISEESLYDVIMMDTCHYTFVLIHRKYTTKNPNAIYGL